jgi:hypothetical protein
MLDHFSPQQEKELNEWLDVRLGKPNQPPDFLKKRISQLADDYLKLRIEDQDLKTLMLYILTAVADAYRDEQAVFQLIGKYYKQQI